MIKTCPKCGSVYDAQGWAGLPYVGRMVDDVEGLELRNCPCGSTIAIALIRAVCAGCAVTVYADDIAIGVKGPICPRCYDAAKAKG